jgi:lipopolysaccharide exporter
LPSFSAPPSGVATQHANILTRAVQGAFWTILSGTGARIIGIVGTLAVTHYLSPAEYGEISLAALLMFTASAVANAGVSQYIASKPDAERAAVFHATFYYLLLGIVALGVALALGGPFAWLISAPGIGKYLPLLAAATFIDRIFVIQDRIQVRDMRFRSVGILRSLGELTYSATSVLLAATCAGTMFGGAWALAWATMARSLVRLVGYSLTTPWREWAEPHPITWARTKEFFAYGLPMSIASIANFGSQKFDNFVYSHHFGEAGVGKYNLAYNFADIPAALIAETVGDVLVPSFAHMDTDERRKDSFLLALRTLVLLVTPMALGLSMVAPDLVNLAFPARYEGIADTLRILVMFAIPRTIIWTSVSYLQVRKDPRIIMILETARMFGIVIFMHLFTALARRTLGTDAATHVACASVVAVFTASSFTYMLVIRKLDGVPLMKQILPLVPPTLACGPMMLAVYAVQKGLPHLALFAVDHPLDTFGERLRTFGPRLLIEMVVGAVAFVPSALLLAPTASRELLRMIGDARRRRGALPSNPG